MGKNDGLAQINNADQYYQQLAGESNSLFSQFNQMDLPALQQLFPELQGTLNGTNSTLMNAAEAPVNAQTSRMLNTVQGNLGGVTNPNALYSDIAMQGQQNAGLAADQTVGQSLSALQNLIGMGYGGVQTGTGSLNSAAGGEAQLGTAMNNQSNAWWQAILGAAGQYYGLNHGQNTTQNQPNFQGGDGGGAGMSSNGMGGSMPYGGGGGGGAYNPGSGGTFNFPQAATAGFGSGASSPISSPTIMGPQP